jgi:hypothetical protein
MTVTSLVRSVTAPGDGAQVIFPFTFKIWEAADLIVTLIDAGGNETLQTLTTHYDITGINDDAGGTVVMGTFPSGTEELRIERTVALTQLTSLKTQGSYRAESHEEALDRLIAIAQQLTEEAVGVPIVTSLPDPVAALEGDVLVLDGGTGVAAQARICLETASDGVYAWARMDDGA